MYKKIKALCVVGAIVAVLCVACAPSSAQFILPVDTNYYNSISAGTYLLGFQTIPLLTLPGYSIYTYPRIAAATTLPVDLPSLIGIPPLSAPLISFANPLPLPIPISTPISPSVLWNPYVFSGVGLF